jgi:hypothetical protein
MSGPFPDVADRADMAEVPARVMKQLSVIPATAGGEGIQDHQRASRWLRLAGNRS